MSVSCDLRVIAPRQVVVSRKNYRAFALLYFFDHCPIFCSLIHPQDAFAINPQRAPLVVLITICCMVAICFLGSIKKSPTDVSDFFYGCGGRTWTYDLRVMSPTSYRLLYPATRCLLIIRHKKCFVKQISQKVENWLILIYIQKYRIYTYSDQFSFSNECEHIKSCTHSIIY